LNEPALAITNTLLALGKLGLYNSRVGVDLLKSCTAAISKIIDLLENTMNLQGGDGYSYVVFSLHSSVRALRVLAISDQNKAFLADKNHRTIKLLVRVVKEFVEGVGGGRAGGGENDTISPSLAVLALLELSFIHSEDEDLPKLFPASLDLMSLLQKFMKMMKEKLVLDRDASEDDVTMKESEQAAANLLGRLGYRLQAIRRRGEGS
jgi:hypothetical protein